MDCGCRRPTQCPDHPTPRKRHISVGHVVTTWIIVALGDGTDFDAPYARKGTSIDGAILVEFGRSFSCISICLASLADAKFFSMDDSYTSRSIQWVGPIHRDTSLYACIGIIARAVLLQHYYLVDADRAYCLQ